MAENDNRARMTGIQYPDFRSNARVQQVDPGQFDPLIPGSGGSSGASGGLTDIVSKLIKKFGPDIVGKMGEGLGSMMGPDGATTFAEMFNIPADSWFGANLGYGAGEVSAAIPGLEWAPGMGPSSSMTLGGQTLAGAGGDAAAASWAQSVAPEFLGAQGAAMPSATATLASAPVELAGYEAAATAFPEFAGGVQAGGTTGGLGAGTTGGTAPAGGAAGGGAAMAGMGAAAVVAAILYGMGQNRRKWAAKRNMEFNELLKSGKLDTSEAQERGPLNVLGSGDGGAYWISVDEGTHPSLWKGAIAPTLGKVATGNALKDPEGRNMFKYRGDLDPIFEALESPEAQYILKAPQRARYLGDGMYDLDPETEKYFEENPLPESLQRNIRDRGLIDFDPIRPNYNDGGGR